MTPRNLGDEQSCQQVLRARHLFTMRVFSTILASLTTGNPGSPGTGSWAQVHLAEADDGNFWITWPRYLGLGTLGGGWRREILDYLA